MKQFDFGRWDWTDTVGALLLLFGLTVTAAGVWLVFVGSWLASIGDVAGGVSTVLFGLVVIGLCGFQCCLIGSVLWDKVRA